MSAHLGYASRELCEKLLNEIKPVSCLNCKFFEKFEEATADECNGRFCVSLDGSCLRYPPARSGDQSEDDRFVSTSARFWCGEFVKTDEDRGIDYVYAVWKDATASSSPPPPDAT